MASTWLVSALAKRADIFNGVSLVVRGLNWLFLVEMITVLVAVLFYLFYLSRVLGSLLGTVLTWLLLFRKYNVHLEVESIQFSPLGGRISFKDLRYVSRNQSLRVQTGHLTLRYWFWRVRDNKKDIGNDSVPCRVKVEFEGLEWFVYNRTPSYDAIIDHIIDNTDAPLGASKRSTAKTSAHASKQSSQPESAPLLKEHAGLDAWWADFLPVQIVCKTGAIILGNRATPTLLITGFKNARGTYSVTQSRSTCDFYKEVFDFNFEKPKAVWRSNPDYDESMLKHGARLFDDIAEKANFDVVSKPNNLRFPRFNRLVKALTGFDLSDVRAEPVFAKSSHKKWQGLARYQNQDDAHDPEYARVNTLLECPELHLRYYCDAAGKVPETPIVVPGLAGLESVDIGNGDLSPEWGVDVDIKGGSVNYGPWTDRQRSALQSVFTPSSFFDAEETQKLQPGEARRHSSMKIFIEFSDHTKFRMPTREPSKDWQWDGHLARSFLASHTRHYGWLDAYLGGNSSINFALPMVAGPNGFDMLLEVHVDSLSVFCSQAPDAPIISSESGRVSVQMPSPLKWNEVRVWTIGVALSKTNIRMLREYANLFADVVQDMTSGPPGDLEHFIPMIYHINLQLKDYELAIYLNEHNVVTIPGMETDNTMLHLKGERVAASIDVASDVHQPNLSEVGFKVKADPLTTGITVPLWNTHAAFTTPRTAQFGRIPELSLDGTYSFHSSYHPDLVDTLYMNISSRGLMLKALGWCIRYLINIRDNYFGNYTHRLTAQEFAQQRPRQHPDAEQEKLHHHHVGDPIEQKYRPGRKNAYEVQLAIDIAETTLVVPDTPYDCRAGMMLFVPDAQIHLRNHDLFMEMSANFDPISAILTNDTEHWLSIGRAPYESEQKPHLMIDSVDIFGHRMFGHQPRTSTYMCNWDISIGRVSALLQPENLAMMGRIGRAAALSFPDHDNTLAPEFAVTGDPDANLFAINVAAVEVVIDGDAHCKAVLALQDGLQVRTDDLPCGRYMSHVEVVVPSLTAKALTASDHTGSVWMEVAGIDTDLVLTIGASATGWESAKDAKLSFIEKEDAVTERCTFAYRKDPPTPVASHAGALFAPFLPLSRVRQATKAVSPLSPDGTQPMGGAASRVKTTTADESGMLSDLSDLSPEISPSHSPTRERFSLEGPHQAYRRVLPCLRPSACNVDARRDEPTYASRLASASADGGRELPDAMSRLYTAFSDTQKPDMKDEKASFVRIDSRRGVFVRATPLAAAHLDSLLTAQKTSFDVEHWLDSIHADYVSLRTTPAYRPRSIHLAVFPHRLSVATFQDVLQAEEPSTPEQSRRASYFTGVSNEILSQIELEIKEPSVAISMRSTVTPRPLQPVRDENAFQKASASLGAVSLKLFHAETPEFAVLTSDRSSSDSAHSTAPVLDMAWTGAKLELQADVSVIRPDADLGDIKLDFAETAAELILGSQVAWQRALTKPVRHLRSKKQHDTLRQRHVFMLLARYLETDPSQPVFLTRGSPLLDWTSTSLRFDRGWQVLVNLRQGLRVSPEDYEDFNDEQMRATASRSAHDLLAEAEVLVASWRSWERGDDAIIESELLAQVFGSIARAEATAFSLPRGAKQAAFHARLPSITANLLDMSQAFNCAYLKGLDVKIGVQHNAATDEIAIAGKVAVHDMSAQANPDLLALVKHILQVVAIFEQKRLSNIASERRRSMASPVSPVRPDKAGSFRPNLHVSCALLIRNASVKTEAHGMLASASLRDVGSFIDARLREEHFGVAVFFGFQSLEISAVEGSRYDTAPVQPDKMLVMLSLEGPRAHLQVEDVHVARLYIGMPDRLPVAPKISVAINSGAFRLRVLKHVLRLHEFFQDWSTEALPKSRYVLQELKEDLTVARSPIKQRRRAGSVSSTYVRSTRAKWQDIATLQLSLSIESVAIELQAMPTLRVDYRMDKAFSFGSYRPPPPRSGHHRRRSSQTSITTQFEVAFEIVEQSVHFLPTDSSTQQPLEKLDEAVTLPAIKIAVHNKEHKLAILAVLETVVIRLTAGMLDSILAAQKHFGEDLDDLLKLINAKRARALPKRMLTTTSPAKAAAMPTRTIPLWTAVHAQIALRGFKVAVDAPLAVQNIQAQAIEGSVSKANGEPLFWQLKAGDLALHLEQKHARGSEEVDRLAYFGIDLSANNRPRAVANLPSVASEKTSEEPPIYLHVQLARLHAIMQPATIDALGEVIDYYTDEIQARRADRGKEIELMQVRVKQTLFASDVAPGPSPATLLERMILSVRLENVGVAIPLVDGDLDIPIAERKSHLRAAFLFAVPTIDFATRKGSAGFAHVENLSMQFVPVFDQHNKRHYAAEMHETTTSFLLPSMSCTVQPRRVDQHVRQYRIDSSVSGLRLDLDPTIASYAFRLIDVFHLSQARFEKLASAEKLEAFGLAPTASTAEASVAHEPSLPGSTAIVRSSSGSHKALTVSLTFEFEYGEIHFHPRPVIAARPKHKRTHSAHGHSAPHRRDGPAFATAMTMSPLQLMSPGLSSARPKEPVFVLPALSIKAEYRDRHHDQLQDDRSDLHVTAVLHGSRNTLHPNILPFFDELTTDVKTRLRRPTMASSPTLTEPAKEANAAIAASVTPQSISRLQLAISLRIDDSCLTFSCQPEAQVLTALEWKSGGFLFTMTPGSRQIGFVARINEVGIDLQHVFAAGTGARAVAAHLKGLVASVVLARPNKDALIGGVERRTLTISVNAPSLVGDINMRQLHDALCAQRVWLDRIGAMKPADGPVSPPSSAPGTARSKSSFAAPLAPPGATTLLDVLVAARIEHLSMTCDMGMVIGTLKATGENTIARLRLVPGDSRAFSISFDTLETEAEGRLKGAFKLAHSGFTTTLYDQTMEIVKERDELFSIGFRIGELHAALDYDFRRILLAEADPIYVSVTDDWRSMSTNGLNLTFQVVMGGFTLVATATSVATTIGLVQEIERLLDAAEEKTNEQFAGQGHRRKSKGDAVNAIAAARMRTQSGRKKSTESLSSSTAPGLRIAAALRVEIGRLCVVVFPSHFSDTTVWRIDLTSVGASLSRNVEQDEHVHRVLDLKLTAATANKLTPKKLSAAEERDLDLAGWLKQLENRSHTGESNILKVPAITVSMTSWQLVSSPRVEHNYKLHWSSGVTITLNVGLLKETKNLVVEVMQRVSSAVTKRSAARKKVDLPEIPVKEFLPHFETPVSTANAKGDGQTTAITMAQSPALAAATHTHAVLVYVEREPAQIEHPRLQTLGDATPPVMRSIMARAPAVTHSFVVSSLESLLLVLTSTYETQLAARGGEAFFAART